MHDYASFFVISYSPTKQGIDGIVSIAARADRVELYFNHGPQLPDPKQLLLGSGKLTRFIRIEAVRQLAHPDVEAFIAAAIDHSSVALPSRGKGRLVIKANKTVAAKKPSRLPELVEASSEMKRSVCHQRARWPRGASHFCQSRQN